MAYEMLKNMIHSSNRIVCLCGLGTYKENGYVNFREDDEAYDIEMSYGYSPEELFSSTFFHTRAELFYKYYKNNVLQLDITPNQSFEALAKLEESGKLKCTITKSIFPTLEKAGCKKIINLLGSISEHTCPRCHKKYAVDYIRNSKKVPLCENCNACIRPGVTLLGEMISNSAITEAASAIMNAETLLVIGCNLNVFMSEKLLQYYNGNHLILINEEEHYTDKLADFVIHKKVVDVLPEVVRELWLLSR
jgi:NAD-dependent protein deacetylase/lipoamidase